MTHPLILLFDFDGVVITQKALEFTALRYLKKRFYNWKNTESLRLIDIARLFEESDSSNKLKALFNIYRVYKHYIPSRWKRILFFIKFRRTFPKYEKHETLKPNLEKVLEELKKREVIFGIVSNTSGERLGFFRSRLNLDDFFSVYISRDDTPMRKPHGHPVLIALRQIKRILKVPIDKNKVYLIGDLPTDIECATNAGVKSIALLSGHGTKTDLELANPSIILQEINDILEIDPFKKLLLD
ncbi:MAG: HAD family hydrolase [Candidatus Lokiarchaeota archaeon]|nr:HAD family hydrolase [Candidatus Lokiarchaeota archaeon]